MMRRASMGENSKRQGPKSKDLPAPAGLVPRRADLASGVLRFGICSTCERLLQGEFLFVEGAAGDGARGTLGAQPVQIVQRGPAAGRLHLQRREAPAESGVEGKIRSLQQPVATDVGAKDM